MGQALAVQVQGQGVVSADNLNTYQQTADNVAALRGFVGAAADGVTVQVYIRGQNTVGDGGQGVFYWNPTGTAPDDNGLTTVVPSGASSGEWTRLGSSSGGSIVTGPGASNNGFVPQWSGTGGNILSGGLPVGTTGKSTIIETQPTGFLNPLIIPAPTVAAVGVLGVVSPDGTSITILNGIISAAAAVGNGPNLLATLTASSSPTLSDTTHITSSYKSYEFRFINIVPATTNVVFECQLSTNNGGSYDTGGNYVSQGVGNTSANGATKFGSASATYIQFIQDTLSNTAANGGLSGIMTLFNPATNTVNKQWTSNAGGYCNTTNYENAVGFGSYLGGSQAAVNAIQFLMSAGNIASGTIEIWGIP